jgi:hypothetical protein
MAMLGQLEEVRKEGRKEGAAAAAELELLEPHSGKEWTGVDWSVGQSVRTGD